MFVPHLHSKKHKILVHNTSKKSMFMWYSVIKNMRKGGFCKLWRLVTNDMYKYEKVEKTNFLNTRFLQPKSYKKIFKIEKNKNDNNKKHTIDAVKFLFMCLVLVSSMVAISIAVNITEKGDNALGLSDYDNFIWPVVMQNPENFNDNLPADVDTMVCSAVWRVAMDKKTNLDLFNEDQMLVVDLKDVQEACKELFDRTFEKSDLKNINEDFFTYDFKTDKFLVKSISGAENYIPHTVNAYKKGEDIVLKVGYVVPAEQFEPSMENLSENKIEKYKVYRLKTNKTTGKKYVAAVE